MQIVKNQERVIIIICKKILSDVMNYNYFFEKILQIGRYLCIDDKDSKYVPYFLYFKRSESKFRIKIWDFYTYYPGGCTSHKAEAK